MNNLIKIEIVRDLAEGSLVGLTDMLESGLYILKTPTHFRAIKNRYDSTHDEEHIPNFMLESYLKRFMDRHKRAYIDNLLKNYA